MLQFTVTLACLVFAVWLSALVDIIWMLVILFCQKSSLPGNLKPCLKLVGFPGISSEVKALFVSCIRTILAYITSVYDCSMADTGISTFLFV